MQKAQAEIAAMEVTGESGGGMVKVTINGRHEAKRVQIDPSVPLDDREMVEDLVAAAINDAVHRLESVSQERMSGLMGGMELPPGLKLPLGSTAGTMLYPPTLQPADRGAALPARRRAEDPPSAWHFICSSGTGTARAKIAVR